MPLNLGELNVHLKAIGINTFIKDFDSINKKISDVSSSIKTIGKISAGIFAGLAGSIGLVVRASDTQAIAMQRLETAIRGTGKAINAMNIAKLASDLQKVTRFGDEVTIEAAAMLTTFQLTEDQILDLIPRVQNLAEMYQMDLRQAAIQVGRALTAGAGALSRYGITLSDAEKAAFDLADQQQKINILLNILDKNTGPAARDMVNSISGAYAQMTNELGDVQEKIGDIFRPTIISGMQKIRDVLQNVNNNLANLSDESKNTILNLAKITFLVLGTGTALGLLATSLTIAGKAFGFFWAFGSALVPLLLIGSGIAAVGGMIYTAWNQNWGGIKDKIKGFADTALEKFEALKTWWNESDLKEIITNSFNQLKNIWTNEELSFPEKVVKTAEISINTLIATAVEVFKITKNIAIPLLETAVDTLKPIAINAIDFTAINADFIQTGLNIIIGLQLARHAGAALLGAISGIFGKFSAGVAAIGGGALAIATLSIAVALAEAVGEKSFKNFGANLIAALAAGIGIGAFTGSPYAGALAFTIVLNFKVGEWINDNVFKPLFDPAKKAIKSSTDHLNYEYGSSGGSFVFKGNFLGFHSGGLIPGKSGPDKFPALVAPGEAIVPASAVRKGAPGVLEWFKKMGVPGFKTGKAPVVTGNLNTDIVNVGNFLSNISNMVSDITKVITKAFELVGKFIINLAKKIFGEENVQDLINLFNEFKNLFTVPSTTDNDSSTPTTPNIVSKQLTMWDKIFNTFQNMLDIAKGVLQDLGSKVFQSFPIAQDVTGGYAAGGIKGAFTALIANSQTFANIINLVNPILQAFANMIGMLLEPLLPLITVLSSALLPIFTVIGTVLSSLLEPAFRLLFPILKYLGIAASFVAEVFQRVRAVILDAIGKLAEGLGDFLQGITFWHSKTAESLQNAGKSLQDSADDARESAGDLKEKREELIDLTYDEAMARAKNNEELQKLNEALRNVPIGFKVALARFNSAVGVGTNSASSTFSSANAAFDPSISAASADSATVNINVYRNIYGVDDVKNIVRDAMNEYNRVRRISLNGGGISG